MNALASEESDVPITRRPLLTTPIPPAGVGLVVVSIGAYVWLSYKPSPSTPPAAPADEFNKGGDGAQLTGSAAPFGKVSETTGLLKGSSTV